MTVKGQISFEDFISVWSHADHLSVAQAKDFFLGKNNHYGLKHSFGYPGEVLERFVERDGIASLEGIRALALVACATSNEEYEFYQEQKVQFADQLSSTKVMKEDGILQALAAYWRVAVLKEEASDSFVSLLKVNEERLTVVEMLLAMPEQELVRPLILKVVSTIDLDSLLLKEAEKKASALKSFALFYEFFRPKKSDCKDFLQLFEITTTAWRLSKKELQVDSTNSSLITDYTTQLACTRKELMLIHHSLFIWVRNWAKVTEVAKDRVFDEWLKAELTDSKTASQYFKNEMLYGARDKDVVGKKIAEWFSEVVCEDNLMFIKEYTGEFVHLGMTTSVISKMNHPIFTKENGIDFISMVTHEENFPPFWEKVIAQDMDRKCILQLIEDKRISWELAKDTDYVSQFVSKFYLQALVSEEVYEMKTFEEWKELGLRYAYVSYLKSIQSTECDRYVTLLSEIPVESKGFLITTSYRTFGMNDKKINFSEVVFEKTSKKQLYLSVIMQVVYHHLPSAYGNMLYKFYKDGSLTHAGLTENDISLLLEKAVEHSLFEDRIREEIAEKFMSSEEKLEKEILKAIEQIEKAYNINSLQRAMNIEKDLLQSERIQEALANRFSTIDFKQYHNKPRELYGFITKLELEDVVQNSVIVSMKEVLNKYVIESTTYTKSDISYLHYVTQILEDHYQNEEEKENELCKAAI